MFTKSINQDYVRSIVFGFQDALVSTTGIVVGISAAVNNRNYILLTAAVTIIIEALSMAAGQYLSEKSVHDLPKSNHQDDLFIGSILMFLSYIIGGIIPVIPFLFSFSTWTPILSVISAFAGLFILGYLKDKLFIKKSNHGSIEMLIVGGITVLIGLLIGSLF